MLDTQGVEVSDNFNLPDSVINIGPRGVTGDVILEGIIRFNDDRLGPLFDFPKTFS